MSQRPRRRLRGDSRLGTALAVNWPSQKRQRTGCDASL